jgi:hypothetical protein
MILLTLAHLQFSGFIGTAWIETDWRGDNKSPQGNFLKSSLCW